MAGILRTLSQCSVLAVCLTLSGQAAADEVYYRWTDDRGQPVHSDRPPPVGIDYEVVRTGSSLKRPVQAEEGAVPASLEPKVSAPMTLVEEQPAVQKNPEYCARARENLELLNTRARIRLRDDQGEFRYLSEDDKVKQREAAQAAINDYCE